MPPSAYPSAAALIWHHRLYVYIPQNTGLIIRNPRGLQPDTASPKIFILDSAHEGSQMMRQTMVKTGIDPRIFSGAAFNAIAEQMKTPEQKLLESSGKPSEALQLNKFAQLILQIDAQSYHADAEKEAESKDNGRKRLAASLGCTTQDLQDIVDSFGTKWQELILEERIAQNIASVQVRDVSWDRLESTVLTKLLFLIDANRVGGVGELLAIAKAANQAIRGNRKLPQATPTPGGIQNNIFFPGAPQDGVLPSGNLGRIQLNLTPRVFKQIEGQADRIEGGARQIDSIEMMTIQQIQDVVDDNKVIQPPAEEN